MKVFGENKHIENIFNDGSIILSSYQDNLITHNWKFKKNLLYTFSIDICLFPEFNSINFIPQAKHSMEIQNAGGSSEKSEALSMQYMSNMFGAKNFIPEMEVSYWIEYKICDFLMQIKNENIGVSVTRAFNYPFNSEFTYEKALWLLNKKLYGLIIARNCISKKHKFFRSILHIWCLNMQTANTLKKAFNEIIINDTEKTYSSVYIICSICDQHCIYMKYF